MSHPDTPRAVHVLRGGALVFALIGTAVSVWLIDKAVRYPEIRAGQFGNEAPLWIPILLFVVICTGGACYLFLHAARRVAAGEDLFDRRHRRHPSERHEPAEPQG